MKAEPGLMRRLALISELSEQMPAQDTSQKGPAFMLEHSDRTERLRVIEKLEV